MKYKFDLSTFNFKELKESGSFFVDKSLFIKEVIEENSKIVLIPRPRRFGKSLNFSMLKYFFDMKEKSANLFKGLEISNEKECLEHMNKYPVVLISMKDAAVPNWNLSKKGLKVTMSEIYRDYREEVMDVLDESERKYCGCIMNEEATDGDLVFSLSKLTKHLERKHDEKVWRRSKGECNKNCNRFCRERSEIRSSRLRFIYFCSIIIDKGSSKC